MSGLDPQAKKLCNVCGKPFYDPEQGSVKEYRYTMRYVSDAHRAMFHSGDKRDLNYDPNYYDAHDRIEKRRAARVDQAWREYVAGVGHMAELTRDALATTTEPPNVSRETGDTHADHRPTPEPYPHP